ncbi:MAG: MauE/DoxX family redox-associated membrane protein [Acidobacteriota bacterium]
MARLLGNVYLAISLRIFLGLVFVAAALGKIREPAQFAHAIDNFKVLDTSVVNLVAIFLPWIELASGLALCAGVLTRGAAFLVAQMLATFLAALSLNLARGNDIECTCFGALKAPPIPIVGELLSFFLLSPKMTVTIWRDAVLLGMTCFVLYSPVVWRRPEAP